MSSNRADEARGTAIKSKGEAKIFDGGPIWGAIGTAIILSVVGFGLYLIFNIIDFLFIEDAPPPLTQQEVAEQAIWQSRRAAFESSQSGLWALPASNLTEEGLVGELTKCQDQIKQADKSPYHWTFDYDTKSALEDVKLRGSTDIASLNRKDVPISNNVELAEYTCMFEGAGYKDFVKNPDTRYTNSY